MENCSACWKAIIGIVRELMNWQMKLSVRSMVRRKSLLLPEMVTFTRNGSI